MNIIKQAHYKGINQALNDLGFKLKENEKIAAIQKISVNIKSLMNLKPRTLQIPLKKN